MHWSMVACHIDSSRDFKRRRCHGQDDILILEPSNANRNSPALLSSTHLLRCSNASDRNDRATPAPCTGALAASRCRGSIDRATSSRYANSEESATEFAWNLSRYLVIRLTRSIKIS